MNYNKSKRGSQGIGTLIIFIAMILVAAVAAGVLIQTASSLQGKSEVTGKQVQERLGTGFTIIEVSAANTSDGEINNGTDYFEVVLRLAPGSNPVKLSDLTITTVTSDGTESTNYFDGASDTTHFNVTYESNGGNASTDGYIDTKDVVRIRYNAPYTIGENEDFTIRLFPGVGDAQPIALVTPASMLDVYSVLK